MLEAGRAGPLPVADRLELRRLVDALCHASRVTNNPENISDRVDAAIAALKRVFVDDAERFLLQQPISTTIACAVCLIFAFSIPMAKLKEKYRFFALLGALGLLPGFVLAGIIGPMVGEVSYDIQWGILIPPLDDAWAKVSPFAIGWPSMEMFIQGMPLALITAAPIRI